MPKIKMFQHTMDNNRLKVVRRLWKSLVTSTVTQVNAHYPDDVFMVAVPHPEHPWCSKYLNGTDIPSARPVEDERTKIFWSRFSGQAGDFSFDKKDGRGLDLDADVTLTWSRYANHIQEKIPQVGETICGLVKGNRYTRWFVASPEFLRLLEYVRSGQWDSDEEMGRLLLTSGWPDQLWAIARYVAFGDDRILNKGTSHPAMGMKSPSGFTVDHTGMWLSMDPGDFLQKIQETCEGV